MLSSIAQTENQLIEQGFKDIINNVLKSDKQLKDKIPIYESDDLVDVIKDGHIFCKLINLIKSGNIY